MVRKALIKDIAVQRIEKLLQLAIETYNRDPELSRKYVELAVRVKKKANVRLKKNLKLLYCKKCFTPLIPGVTSRVRIRQNRFSHITITCLNCGYVKRIPLRLKDSMK